MVLHCCGSGKNVFSAELERRFLGRRKKLITVLYIFDVSSEEDCIQLLNNGPKLL